MKLEWICEWDCDCDAMGYISVNSLLDLIRTTQDQNSTTGISIDNIYIGDSKNLRMNQLPNAVCLSLLCVERMENFGTEHSVGFLVVWKSFRPPSSPRPICIQRILLATRNHVRHPCIWCELGQMLRIIRRVLLLIWRVVAHRQCQLRQTVSNFNLSQICATCLKLKIELRSIL